MMSASFPSLFAVGDERRLQPQHRPVPVPLQPRAADGVPRPGDRRRPRRGSEASRIRSTGNSFAAPHIAGIAALIKSKHPELRPFQLKTVLWATAANVQEAPRAAGRLSQSMQRTRTLRSTGTFRGRAGAARTPGSPGPVAGIAQSRQGFHSRIAAAVSYRLGIDLGTTYTAAAIVEDGRASIFPLGNRAPVVPTVIFLRPDNTIVIGDAANRRAVTEPRRVAREFKRRMGDPTPMLLGGTPMSAARADGQDAALDRRRGRARPGRPCRAHHRVAPGELGAVQARPPRPDDPDGRARARVDDHRAGGGGHLLRLDRAGRGRRRHRRLRPRRRHLRRGRAAQDRRTGSRSSATRRESSTSAGSTSTRRCTRTSSQALGTDLDQLDPDDPRSWRRSHGCGSTARRRRRRCRATPTARSRSCCPAITARSR